MVLCDTAQNFHELILLLAYCNVTSHNESYNMLSETSANENSALRHPDDHDVT